MSTLIRILSPAIIIIAGFLVLGANEILGYFFIGLGIGICIVNIISPILFPHLFSNNDGN
jgi:hypothetical protein